MNGTDVSNGFRLDSSPDNPIEVQIGSGQASGNVAVTVVNNKMEPVGNVMVAMVPNGRGAYKYAWADMSGNVRFTDVAPGDYKLYAWEDVELYAWQSPDFMRDFVSRGKQVHLESGGSSAAQVTVIPYAPKN